MLVKHKMAGAAPEAVAGGTLVISAVVTSPLLVASPPSGSLPLDSVASLLALGAGGTGLAFVLYYTLIADVGPARASMVGYVAPAFSIVYGVVLLGESADRRGDRRARRSSSPGRGSARRGGCPGSSAEADLPVRARPLLRALDERPAA